MATMSMSTGLKSLAITNTCSARPRAALPVSARLVSGASHLVPTPVVQPKLTRRTRGQIATRAGEVTYELAPEGNREYAPILGILGLVAHIYNKVHISAPQLLKTVAAYQLLVVAIGLVFRKAQLDNLASIVAPGILAVAVLNFHHVTYADAAVGLFGYYLSEHLEGPFWVWIATLAAAIYAGYPSHWFVGATGVAAGLRLVRGAQNDKVPVLTVPTVLAAAYAFWKELTPQLTIALIIGSIVASALQYIESVSDSS